MDWRYRWALLALFGGLLILGLPVWDASWAQLRPSDDLGLQEPWRLLLGHWIHYSWAHLALNWTAFIGWILLWRLSLPERVAMVGCISVLTGMGVNLLVDYEFVVGLSGLLHGLFVASAVIGCARRETLAMNLVVLGLVAAKLGYEQVVGASLATEQLIGLPVARDAHLIGAAAGAAYAAGRIGLIRRLG